MFGEKNVLKLLSSMSPALLEGEFVFGSLVNADSKLLASLQPIGTFQEKEGLTVILKKEIADEYKISYSGLFKCITLNVRSSLAAVGLTAAVSSALAGINISANVVAGFYHDHIFVSSKDATKALSCLKKLTHDYDPIFKLLNSF